MIAFLKKSVLFAVAGSYRSLLLVLLLPLWTHYLSPAEIGLFALVMISAQILARVGGGGLAAAASRFYIDFEDDIDRFKGFVSTLMLTSCAIALFCLIVGVIAFEPCSRWIFDDEVHYWWYTLTLFIFLLVLQLQMVLFVVRGEALKSVVITVFPQTLGVLIALILVALYSMGLEGRIIGLLVGEGVAALVAFGLLYKKYFIWNFKQDDAKVALLYGLPLMFHAVSQLLLQSGDRFVIFKYCDADSVGLYTVATILTSGLLLMQGAANQVWAPKYLRLLKARDIEARAGGEDTFIIEVNDVFRKWSAFFGLISVGMILFGGDVLKILAPDSSYRAADQFIAPLTIGVYMIGLYFFGVNVVMHLKKTKLVPIYTGLCMVLNIVLNMWLIPVFGAVVAAWTTLLCNFILCAIFHYVARKKGGVHYRYTFIGVVIGCQILAALIQGAGIEILYGIPIFYLKCIVLVCLCGVITGPFFKQIKDMLRRIIVANL